MHESPHDLERLLSKLPKNISIVRREDTHVTSTRPAARASGQTHRRAGWQSEVDTPLAENHEAAVVAQLASAPAAARARWLSYPLIADRAGGKPRPSRPLQTLLRP